MNRATRENFLEVFDRIRQVFVEADEDEQDVYVESLNNSLDELLAEDFFGTEGQLDPRGDQREG